MTDADETTEIILTFPVKLLEELQTYLPHWQEEQFLTNLLERELRRVRLKKALKDSAGAWSDEDHPELATAEDIEAYVRNLRDRDIARSWEEIIAEDSGE